MWSSKDSSKLMGMAGVVAVHVMLSAATASAQDSTSVTGEPNPISVQQSQLGQPVPDSVIVKGANGLEWVWASPCAQNGCTDGIDVGHDGFKFATPEQWAIRPSIDAFRDSEKCASPWFDHTWDHCDWWDPEYLEDPYYGAFGSAPVGGLPAGVSGLTPMQALNETWLVRMSTIQVTIDIKPEGVPNSINLCSKGAVPVAIMGSDTFDVNNINPSSLTLAGATVKAVKYKILCGTEDVNADGYADLVCHFNTTELALDKTSTSATVKGKTVEGTQIEGSDSIVIVKDGCE